VRAVKFGIFHEHQLPRPWNDGDELREPLRGFQAAGVAAFMNPAR
jgi:hypothetical protein